MQAPVKLRAWERPGKVFLVWCPELGYDEPDARRVEAHDAQSAAADWAELDDQGGDYVFLTAGHPYAVHVKLESPGPGEAEGVEVYDVVGESVPQYTAHRRAPA